ncbi:MAG: LysE family transporter [Acidaminococcaceae bacterium]
MWYFWQGVTVGLAYLAPIGMQNLFVINSALAQSARRAILTAFIVACFDITLALACFYGVGLVLERYHWVEYVLLAGGGSLVTYIGWSILSSEVDSFKRMRGQELTVRQTITSACVVTWLNPQAIVDGTMLLGAFRASLPVVATGFFIGGVVVASLMWFNFLVLGVRFFEKHFNAQVVRNINILSGSIVIFYGFKLLWSFLVKIQS